MNPTLISLHRLGVFRQPRFTLNSFTSDFGLSLVDLSVAIHICRNNYPSAVDNHFICSLLDKEFCAVQKKKEERNTSRSNMNFLIGVPNTEYTRCPVG